MSEPAETATFHERRWVVVLFVAALVLRFAWLLELTTLPWGEELPTDSAIYDAMARRIASGDWLLGPHPLRMSPGYFYALGALYELLGPDPWLVRVVQAVAGSACVPLTWSLARQWLAPRPAVIAAGLVAFAGPLVFFDGALLPESFATLLLLLTTLLLARAVPSEGTTPQCIARWAAAGVSLGALATLRPNALLLIAVAGGAAWLFGVGRARHAQLAALLLGAALFIAPITARNLIASDRFVLLTSHAGVNLYVGNGPGATGTFRVPPEIPGGGSPTTQFESAREAASREAGRPLDEHEADRHWQRRTLEHVATHPWSASVLFARKVHLLFNARELGLVLPYAFSRIATRTLGAPLVQSGLLAPLALIGALIALFRPVPRAPEDAVRARPARSSAAIMLTFAFSVALVFVTDRYRAPLLPLYAVFTVAGGVDLLDAWRSRDTRRAGCLTAAALLAVVLAVPVRAQQHFEREWVAFGESYLARDEPDRALEAFEAALTLVPGQPLARHGAALASSRLGLHALATQHWRALEADSAAPAALRRTARQALSSQVRAREGGGAAEGGTSRDDR